jgi:hypothetical protein
MNIKLYRFSPIKSEHELFKVYGYITVKLEKLSKKLFNSELPITTLKVFPHYPDEYDFLYNIVSDMGKPASYNSKTSYYSRVKKKIKGYDISYLGVRIVDPYRLQVGCGDYEIDNFDGFKKQHLNKSPHIRQFQDKEVVEVWHPDFDVLGYVIPEED